MVSEIEREAACVPDLTDLLAGYQNDGKEHRILDMSDTKPFANRSYDTFESKSHRILTSMDLKNNRTFDLQSAPKASKVNDDLQIGEYR